MRPTYDQVFKVLTITIIDQSINQSFASNG